MFHMSKKPSTVAVITVLMIEGSSRVLAQPSSSIPLYTIQRIGLFGPEYETPNHYLYSAITDSVANSPYNLAGFSERYIGTGIPPARDAWVWNGTETRKIGLSEPEHYDSLGTYYSQPSLLNNNGQVAGWTLRNMRDNRGNYGVDTWVWNGSSLTQIGLTGGVYTNNAGYQSSRPLFQDDAGHVVGISEWANGAVRSNGFSLHQTWIWNSGVTTLIGLDGPSNTSIGGLRSNYPQFLNAAGQVSGISYRFINANIDNGQDAWIWNGSTTIQIGLTGGEYTGSAGYQNTSIIRQNALGYVVGYSFRYTGEQTNLGHDAWVWNGITTKQIGLTGGVYTGSGGYQKSAPNTVATLGSVVGYSERYSGANTDLGRDVWIWMERTLFKLA